jgi:hypothetical protein
MKKHFTLFCCLILATMLSAQDPGIPKENNSTPGRFYAGLNYAFLHNDMHLCKMTLQSVWRGDDYGLYELNDEEIDLVNESTTFSKNYQGISIQAGYRVLADPDSRWRFDAGVILGLMTTHYKTTSENYDSLTMDVSSGLDNPAVGLNLRFDYKIKGSWSVSLVPYAVYSWGKPKEIDDKATANISFLDKSSNYSFDYLYVRLTPMVTYDFRKVRISAGPGFYYLYLSTKYDLRRTNPDNGFLYEDYTNTTMRSKYFIDGTLHCQWQIMNPLVINLMAAYGGDFVAHAGIVYSF